MKNAFLKVMLGIILLLAMFLVQQQYKEIAKTFREGLMLYGFLLGLLYFLFGIFIEFEKVKDILTKRTWKIEWSYLALTLVLIVLISIPVSRWVLWFGLGGFQLINPLMSLEIKAILTVLAGILLVRSINNQP